MSERVSEIDAIHINDGYEEFERNVREHAASYAGKPIFTTDAGRLWELYLAGLPESHRQHYNCHACRDFIERYGGLVTVSESFALVPVMWPVEVPALFANSVKSIREAIMKAKITGVFLSEESVLGNPITGQWTHLSAPNIKPFAHPLKSVTSAIAEKKSDYILLKQSMIEYPIAIINQVLLLLRSDALYRSEKVIGVVEWFKRLLDSLEPQKNGRTRDNMLWQAVAIAPPGYCHIKNTVVGSLLDDLVSGTSYDEAARRFAAKMHPLQYQRPEAAPSAGNIKKAEEIVEKLGIAKSLVRRFARFDEISCIWKPKENVPENQSGGVFSHLIPKGKTPIPDVNMSPIAITWRKFSEEVLPIAKSIDALVPSVGNFTAILTAEHHDAPPILQWDSLEHRNPCSVYVYSGGSIAEQWGLSPGYTKVNGVCYEPAMWQEGFDHQGKGVVFILDGAKDSRTTQGNALFPETLKSELREVRSTIEAYSRQAEILGYGDASACGLAFGGNGHVVLKVTTDMGIATYDLDRWG